MREAQKKNEWGGDKEEERDKKLIRRVSNPGTITAEFHFA
jgi:hypothetical protein